MLRMRGLMKTLLKIPLLLLGVAFSSAPLQLRGSDDVEGRYLLRHTGVGREPAYTTRIAQLVLDSFRAAQKEKHSETDKTEKTLAKALPRYRTYLAEIFASKEAEIYTVKSVNEALETIAEIDRELEAYRKSKVAGNREDAK